MAAVAGRRGLLRVILPHYDAARLLGMLARRHPAARCDDRAFEEIRRLSRCYFSGAGAVDFGAIECDLPGEKSFAGMVYRACMKVPCGQTVSYSRLAQLVCRPLAVRAVAAAMSRNPLPLVVPCHRVINADGTVGGFSAPGGEALKRRMLGMEGSLQPPAGEGPSA